MVSLEESIAIQVANHKEREVENFNRRMLNDKTNEIEKARQDLLKQLAFYGVFVEKYVTVQELDTMLFIVEHNAFEEKKLGMNRIQSVSGRFLISTITDNINAK